MSDRPPVDQQMAPALGGKHAGLTGREPVLGGPEGRRTLHQAMTTFPEYQAALQMPSLPDILGRDRSNDPLVLDAHVRIPSRGTWNLEDFLNMEHGEHEPFFFGYIDGQNVFHRIFQVQKSKSTLDAFILTHQEDPRQFLAQLMAIKIFAATTKKDLNLTYVYREQADQLPAGPLAIAFSALPPLQWSERIVVVPDDDGQPVPVTHRRATLPHKQLGAYALQGLGSITPHVDTI